MAARAACAHPSQSARDEDDVGLGEFKDTLCCGICADLLHDCVSLQPCLHSFCGGCASEWSRRSTLCPTCRREAEFIGVNHRLNDVVESYLKHHPEERRDDEELAELDRKNLVKQNGGLLPLQSDVKKRSSTRPDGGASSSRSTGDDDSPGWLLLGGALAVGAVAGGLLTAFLSSKKDDEKK